MCIGHGIRVAARAFVTFVKGRMKCLLLLLLLTDNTANLLVGTANILKSAQCISYNATDSKLESRFHLYV